MDDDLFAQLQESIEEAGAHMRGEQDLPEENIHFAGEPDPRAIREKLGVTQKQFAAMLDIPVSTLQGWEQGRRSPRGPAMKLLRIAERRPEVLLEVA